MPPEFSKKEVDGSIERNIITAAILSDEFLLQFKPMYQPVYMKNIYGKVVIGWALDYFDKFGESPKHNIQSIYDVEKGKLDPSDSDIIRIFLVNLSKLYVSETTQPNYDYILHQTKKYFQHREITVRVETAQKYLLIGNDEKAEAEITGMKKVLYELSGWSDPFDSKHTLSAFEEQHEGIFKFPGALGEFIGSLKRGWFVAILGAYKRGKSWYLQEAALQAALSGLKAVFISLEMQDKNIHERMYRRLTAFVDNPSTHQVVPVFDCVKNQTGSCTKPNRKNQITLIKDDVIPEFSIENKYRICTACRMVNNSGENRFSQEFLENAKEFEPTTWYEYIPKKEYTYGNVVRTLRAIKTQVGDNVRVKCYPRFSATLNDLKRDIDRLEIEEGFVPDVIVIDYADILKPENNASGEVRHSLDDIWKKLAGLAAERSCIVFTASQSNRGAFHKKSSDPTDVAEHAGKMAHVDVFLTLNQTSEEKLRGVMRMGMIAHRHKEFNEKDQVTMLLCPSIGQTHLDSFVCKAPEESHKKGER